MTRTRKALPLLIAAFAGAAVAEAIDRYKPLKGEYSVYSGELNDQSSPTPKDRKISILITGQAAKEMFDLIGPDEKDTCAAAGDRSRSRKTLWCTYSRTDGYTCYFGFDLKTGNPIAGGIC